MSNAQQTQQHATCDVSTQSVEAIAARVAELISRTPAPLLVDTAAAAAMLSVPAERVRLLHRSGILKARSGGGRGKSLLFRVAEIERYAAGEDAA